LNEYIPSQLFDYIAAARPTILAIDGVIRKVIEESCGGMFVPPGDDISLEEADQSLADVRPGPWVWRLVIM
jgi:hypothetical protein